MKWILIAAICLLAATATQAQQQKPYVFQPGDYKRGDTVFNASGQVLLIGDARVSNVNFNTGSDETARIDHGVLVLPAHGIRVAKGKNLTLGAGTLPGGRFRFIRILIGAGAQYAGLRWTGAAVVVMSCYRYGNNTNGYTYYLKLKGAKTVFECEVIHAIQAGELTIPGYVPPVLPGNTPKGRGDR